MRAPRLPLCVLECARAVVELVGLESPWLVSGHASILEAPYTTKVNYHIHTSRGTTPQVYDPPRRSVRRAHLVHAWHGACHFSPFFGTISPAEGAISFTEKKTVPFASFAG